MRLFSKLALILLPSFSWAVCASGTVEYWNFSDQSLVGDCFGKTFSATSPVYSNVGCSPATTFAPISFTSAMNMKVTDSSITSMAAGNAYTWEVYIYKYARVANSYAMCFQIGTGTGQTDCLIVGDGSSDFLTVRTNNTQRVTIAGTDLLNNCVYLAWVGTNTYGQLWKGVNGAAPTVVTGVASTCIMTSTVDTLVLGTTAGFTSLSASLNGLRISNVARSSLPTVDPITNNTVRSPYLINYPSAKLGAK